MKNLMVLGAPSWRVFVTIGLALGLRSFVSAATPSIQIQLPDNAKGAAAITALGNKLPDVATAYGLSAQRLTTLLITQPGLGVDRRGLLHFVCAAPAGSAPTVAPSTATNSPSDPFRLHSFPGAPLVIYLDFDGHTTSGTHWNNSFNGGAPIQSAPFDLDGAPGTFNATEQAMIYRIWQRVAEDFAGFAVDVTTEDPGVEALRKTSYSDQVYGVRAVISPTNWYNLNAGGVGYVGSFDWETDTPVFVFTAQLAQSEKPIAESASHEVGHSLRLYHDGSASSGDYFLGHGDWAPIMGAGYYRPVTQFSRGEYSGANNLEDDLSIIASYVPYATDDHGDSLATATPLSGTTISDGGTIERNTDVDVFRFETSAGTISFTIQGPSPEPNLDVQAELLNDSGQPLQTANPTNTLGATLNATLPAGTYYLRIRGTGPGDPATNGYSNYGSVGNYVLTGSLPVAAANQPPTAVAAASATSGTAPLTVTFSSQGSSDSDGAIVSYQWSFGEGGTSTAPNPTYTFTASGSFTVTLTVTDNLGLTGSASVGISVDPAPTGNTPPVFTLHPASQSVPAGGSATFTVAASGSPTPTFTWYRNGMTFPGWTGSTLTLFGITSNDIGTYAAVATNAAGSVTSNSATLNVGEASPPPAVAPSITSHPSSRTATAGDTVTFSASASGTPSPTFQWQHNGSPIAGATNTTLVLTGVTAAQAGSYTFVATNTAGSATSDAATLTVNASSTDSPPTITIQPVSATVSSGGSHTFTIGFTGSPAPTVLWYRDGITFPGWTNPSLELYGITRNDAGTYTAVVTNAAGSVTSAPVTLSVLNPSGKKAYGE